MNVDLTRGNSANRPTIEGRGIALTETRARGRTVKVPSVCIQGRTILVVGKWMKTASVQDEDCLEGAIVGEPVQFLAELKQAAIKPDLFHFSEGPMSTEPRHCYHFEWDNAAIIPIKDHASWWEKLSQETRRNVRKSSKAGVEVKVARFDDELVRGIVDIYNETPIRQGRRFWHYGKSIETVKKETSTYLERSEFIGAYYENVLIGFIKLVCVDKCARIIHILSKEQHAGKRPTNALLSTAVQICADRGLSSLQYQKYAYAGNETSPLTEFKRRNGFERVCFPRYYIPLSRKGEVVLRLKLHHGLGQLLPNKVAVLLRGLRKTVLEKLSRTNSVVVKHE